MSIHVMSIVWRSGPEDRSELLVLLALADFADDDGNCWPSMRAIAEKARMTERGAQKIVQRLAESGWISVVTGGGRHGCNQYHVMAENPERERINPERETPNQKRRMAEKPRTGTHKPRTGVQETPNGRSPEPSRTIKEPSESNARRVLCEVLREEVADAYIQHRKAKRAKLTDHAAHLIARKLSAHPDPNAVVEESIANGWTGVFPERGRSPPPFSLPQPRIRARPPSEYEQ